MKSIKTITCGYKDTGFVESEKKIKGRGVERGEIMFMSGSHLVSWLEIHRTALTSFRE